MANIITGKITTETINGRRKRVITINTKATQIVKEF